MIQSFPECGVKSHSKISTLKKELPMKELIDGNLAVGAILSALVGMLATAILIYFFPHLMAYTFLKVTAWVVLGGGYFLAVLGQVPINHAGVVLLFGKRVRVGKDGKGLQEGWRCLPLPPPLMEIEPVSLEQFKIDFTQTTAYTADNALVTIDGFAMAEIDDPYAVYNVDDTVEGGRKALEGLILRWVREGAEKSDAVKLIKEDKDELSDIARRKVNTDLAGPDTNWGFKPIRLLRIGHIKLPKSLEEALLKRVQEPIERSAEKIQTDARVEQVERLTRAGVHPDIAYPGTLVDAEKPGAEVKGFTVRGLEGLGGSLEDLGRLGKGLSDISRTKGKGDRK